MEDALEILVKDAERTLKEGLTDNNRFWLRHAIINANNYLNKGEQNEIHS